jgi:hypothetical protein
MWDDWLKRLKEIVGENQVGEGDTEEEAKEDVKKKLAGSS